MRRIGILTGVALVAFAVSSASAQQPAGQRLAGTIEKVNGNSLLIKAKDGAEQTVNLADTPRGSAFSCAGSPQEHFAIASRKRNAPGLIGSWTPQFIVSPWRPPGYLRSACPRPLA